MFLNIIQGHSQHFSEGGFKITKSCFISDKYYSAWDRYKNWHPGTPSGYAPVINSKDITTNNLRIYTIYYLVSYEINLNQRFNKLIVLLRPSKKKNWLVSPPIPTIEKSTRLNFFLFFIFIVFL